MVLSKRVSPHVYSVDEVDVTAIAALRSKMKDKFEEVAGTKLTFMPFFIRAAVEGLARFPDGQRFGRRHEHRPAQGVQYRHRRGARLGFDRSGDQERRREEFSGPRAGDERSGPARPSEKAQARGSRRKHVLDHEPRRLRRPVRPAGHQPAERRDPGPGRHRKAPGRDRRRHRHPLDGAISRSPTTTASSTAPWPISSWAR